MTISMCRVNDPGIGVLHLAFDPSNRFLLVQGRDGYLQQVHLGLQHDKVITDWYTLLPITLLSFAPVALHCCVMESDIELFLRPSALCRQQQHLLSAECYTFCAFDAVASVSSASTVHIALPALHGSGACVSTVDLEHASVVYSSGEAPQNNSPAANHPETAPRGAGTCLAVLFVIAPELVLLGFEDGTLHLVDMQCPTASIVSTKVLASAVMALESNMHSREVYACGLDSKGIACIKCDTDAYTLQIVGWMKPQNRALMRGADSLTVRPDGKAVACGCWDGRIRVFSCFSRKQLASLQYHRNVVPAVAFAPHDWILASGARDSTISLWDAFRKQYEQLASSPVYQLRSA